MNFFIGLLITLGIPITLAATWDYRDIIVVDHIQFLMLAIINRDLRSFF